MKKAICFVLSCVFLILILCGCSQQNKLEEGHGKRFMCIYGDFWFEVYVDTETGVEWVRSDNKLQPVIDSYGNPYVYPAFDAREDRLP